MPNSSSSPPTKPSSKTPTPKSQERTQVTKSPKDPIKGNPKIPENDTVDTILSNRTRIGRSELFVLWSKSEKTTWVS